MTKDEVLKSEMFNELKQRIWTLSAKATVLDSIIKVFDNEYQDLPGLKDLPYDDALLTVLVAAKLFLQQKQVAPKEAAVPPLTPTFGNTDKKPSII